MRKQRKKFTCIPTTQELKPIMYLIIHSLIFRYLGCSQFSTIVTNAGLSIHVLKLSLFP